MTRTDVEILSDHVMDFIYEVDSIVSIKEHREALVDGCTLIYSLKTIIEKLS